MCIYHTVSIDEEWNPNHSTKIKEVEWFFSDCDRRLRRNKCFRILGRVSKNSWLYELAIPRSASMFIPISHLKFQTVKNQLTHSCLLVYPGWRKVSWMPIQHAPRLDIGHGVQVWYGQGWVLGLGAWVWDEGGEVKRGGRRRSRRRNFCICESIGHRPFWGWCPKREGIAK